MGTPSKVISACVRVVEIGCSGIIVGVLGKFFYVLNQGGGVKEPRLVYAMSMAVISLVFSLVLAPPAKYSFYCFPLDLSLFICWIVCFALLEDLSGTKTCSSIWYDNYWGYYWGKLWTTTGEDVIVVGDFGCSEWRVVLAFSFTIAMAWLMNAFIGLYVCVEYYNLGHGIVTLARKCKFWKKEKPEDVESQEKVTNNNK